ncbi:MAG TPA: putative LPS assembly protein LptD [Candidatus Latescibacteria bacterium]|nr:putative LPS assembly protein LptD [Candidatus Latescibacterota bacterium]
MQPGEHALRVPCALRIACGLCEIAVLLILWLPAPLRAQLPSTATGERFATFGGFPDSVSTDSVRYAADEIEYDLDTRVITLLGNARLSAAGMSLTAHRIRFLTREDLLIAEGHAISPDSIIGRPEFSSGQEAFSGARMTYNLRTRRGLVEEGHSEVTEGIYGGSVVKRTGERQVDVLNGVYTTCDDNPPHYQFEARQMRVLVGDKVIAKPIVFKVADVPFFWLPFGVFFVDKDRRSGFIAPRMGENRYAGRFMRGLGYYVAPNDYVGGQAVLDIDERIGYEWRLRTDYALRYRFQGSIASDYSKYWDTPSQIGRRIWTVTAQHRQELTPRSSVAANINFTSTSSPYVTSSSTQASVLRQDFTSTVGYTQTWESGYSLRVDARRSQNLQNRQLDVMLPALSISSGQRYFFPEPPPQRGPRAAAAPRQEPAWFRRLGYSWSWSGTNSQRRSPSDRTIFDTWETTEQRGDSVIVYLLTITSTSYINSLYDGTYVVAVENGERIGEGYVQRTSDSNALVLISRSAGLPDGYAIMSGNSLRVKEPDIAQEVLWTRKRILDGYTQTTSQNVGLTLPLPTPRWLTLVPTFNWSASWKSRPDELNANDPQTQQTISGGVSSNATFYGVFPVHLGPVSAVRHVVTPSASFNYVFSSRTRGGTYVFGGRSLGGDTSRIVDLGLRNVFQVKARTSGKERVLDQLLSVSTNARYNRDAKGRRWSDPQTSALFQPNNFISLRLSTVHTLYRAEFDSTSARYVDHLRWTRPELRSITLSTSLRMAGGGRSPSALGNEGFVVQRQETFGGNPRVPPRGAKQGDRTTADWGAWQMNIRHTYQWARKEPGYTRAPEPVNQADISAEFVPWPNWRVSATTTYDVRRNRRDGDALTLVRRLHCWEAQLDWTLRGPFAGYYFRIYLLDIPDIKIESASETMRYAR